MKTKVVLITLSLMLTLSGFTYAVSDAVRDDMYRSWWQDHWRYGDHVIVRTDIDRDNDGAIESVENNEYNNEGLLIGGETTGVENTIQSFTYDENGFLILIETEDVDNNINSTNAYSYATDIVQRTMVSASDAIAYTVICVMTDVFDVNDNHTGQELAYTINPIGMTYSDFHYYTYDLEGNLIREEWDSLNDGSIDEIRVYTYNDNGNCVRDEYYKGGEVTPYYVIMRDYDSNNLCLNEQIDINNDSVVDSVLYYTWQALTDSRGDLDGDGDVDGMDSFNMASSFGTIGCGGCPEDLSGDDNVDDADLSIFAASFSVSP